jgi:hypothetical protein
MAMTNVELYEALKRSIPEEAARLIAEGYPRAADQATKADISGVLAEIAGLRGEIKAVARVQNWMLGLFVPLFAGTWGTVIAVVLKG